ncbi:MAG: RING finger protein [Planctomycetota bacterium]
MNILRLILVTIPVLLTGGIVALIGWIFRLNTQGRAMEALARKYHGIALSRGFHPQVQFPYFGNTCTLGTRSGWTDPVRRQTFLKFPWPSGKLALELAAPALAGRLNRTGLIPAPTGDHEFDREFALRSTDSLQTKQWLDENFRWRFRELSRSAGGAPIALRIDRGLLTIVRGSWIDNLAELDDFLRLGLQLVDQLKVAEVRGIEFVQTEQATVLDDVICPVCSERIGAEMVVCQRCRTPHCRECWEYNTHCATFACGEKRFFTTVNQKSSAG